MNNIYTKRQSLWVLISYFLGYTFLFQILALNILLAIGQPLEEALVNSSYIYVPLTAVIILYLSRNVIKDSLVYLRENFKKLIGHMFKFGGLCILSNIVCGNLIKLITNSSAENQQSIIDSLKSAPVLTVFLGVIFAPIVEELVFREVIFKKAYIKFGKNVAYFISSFVFALVHVLVSVLSGNWIASLFIVQYFVIGYFMCLIYEKHQNVIASILLHFFNNLIAMLILLAYLSIV